MKPSAYDMLRQQAQENHDRGEDIYRLAFAVSLEIYAELLKDHMITMSQMQLGSNFYCMGIHICLSMEPRAVPPIPVFPTRYNNGRCIMGPLDTVLDMVEIAWFTGRGDDAGGDGT